jgi:hypothetical protein
VLRRHAPLELRCDGFGPPPIRPVCAKGGRVEGNDIGMVRGAADEGLQGSVTHMHVQKFVNIHDHQPIGIIDGAVFAQGLVGFSLGRFSGVDVVLIVGDETCSGNGIQQFMRAIGAVIGGDDDARETKDQMMCDPFQQKGAFIPDGGDQGGACQLDGKAGAAAAGCGGIWVLDDKPCADQFF